MLKTETAAPASPELLRRGPLQQVRLDLTTRCNLRCVYCAVSHSTYKGIDMDSDLARRAVDTILQVDREQRLSAVHINGHGETTFRTDWVDICRPLLDGGLPLVMTTNLAKNYSQDELLALAQMDIIMVSIDTADAELLKRLRRRVDLRQIVTNINAIRATSIRVGRWGLGPAFEFSCGLYDQNSIVMEDFARFAVALGVQGVGFWNLTKWHYENFPYELTDVPERDRVYPLEELEDSELKPRVEAIQRGIAILESNNVFVGVNADFVETLARRFEAKPDKPEDKPQGQPENKPGDSIDLAVHEGMTRDCLDPWSYVEIDANGEVKPCCARPPIGNLAQKDLIEILNDEPVRRLRADLLNGTTDWHCTNCRLRRPIHIADLRIIVEDKLHEPREKRDSLSDSNLRHSQSSWLAALRTENLLRSALGHLQQKRAKMAWMEVCSVLTVDPGIKNIVNSGEATIQNYMERILTGVRFPSTLSALAAICRESGDRKGSAALLKRYLELAPDAPDRERILEDFEKEKPPLPTKSMRMKSVFVSGWVKLRRVFRLRSRVRAMFR